MVRCIDFGTAWVRDHISNSLFFWQGEGLETIHESLNQNPGQEYF